MVAAVDPFIDAPPATAVVHPGPERKPDVMPLLLEQLIRQQQGVVRGRAAELRDEECGIHGLCLTLRQYVALDVTAPGVIDLVAWFVQENVIDRLVVRIRVYREHL